MREVAALAVSAFLGAASACTPELRPDAPCAPYLTVKYADSPAGLVSPGTQKIVAAYAGLTGPWWADLQCPSGIAASGTIAVDIRTSSPDEMTVIVGADLSQEGIDCHNAGTVLASGKITWTGSALGGLSGQSAILEARLGEVGFADFTFDTSSSPEFATVEGLLTIEPDLSVAATVVSFAYQPQSNTDRTTSQQGYNCTLALTGRQ
jgi:hypothetical protein